MIDKDNIITSLEAEGIWLNSFTEHIYTFYDELKKETGKKEDSKILVKNLHSQSIKIEENFLHLVNPEIMIISEQYNRFQSIKKQYEYLCMPNTIIAKKLKEGERYFLQFERLRNEYMMIWDIMSNFELLDNRISVYIQVEKIVNDVAKIRSVSPLDILIYHEKIHSREITLEELQNDPYYNVIKYYINYFYSNKEEVREKIINYIAGKQTEEIKLQLKWLVNLHKYYSRRINNIYNKEYSKIPKRPDIQTFLENLEDLLNVCMSCR